MPRTLPAALAWGALGAAACAWMAPLEPSLLEEGMLVHVAERLARGERLYRDVVTFTGPLPYELLALLFRSAGAEIAAGRAAVAALHGAACAAAFALARRDAPAPLAHAAAAGLAGAPMLLFPLYSIYFYSTLAVALALLAAAAAARGVASGGLAVAAGVLVGCAALTKQTVGAVLGPALLAALVAGAPSGLRLRRAGGFAAGAAATLALALAVFAARGDLFALLRATVWLPLGFDEGFRSPFPNLWPPGRFAPEIRRNQAYYLPQLYLFAKGVVAEPGRAISLATQLLYAAPLVALAAVGLRRLRGPLGAGLASLAAAHAALVTNLFPRTDWGHLVFALPTAAALCLAAGPRGRAARLAAAAFAVALGAASLWVGASLRAAAGPPSFGPRVPQRPVSAANRSDAVPHVIRFVREHTLPGDEIFVARSEPLLYFATQTRNPTPFPGVVPGRPAEQEATVLGALGRVRYVVMSDLDQPLYTFYSDELPSVQEYLERHFRVAPSFEDSETTWIVVLERGPDRGPAALDLLALESRARRFVRDASGREAPARSPPPRLAARHNRRPLVLRLGPLGGGADFELEVPPHARFEAGVGLQRMRGRGRYEHPAGATLAVSAARPGEPFRTLAEVRPGEHGPGLGWIPLEADLAPFAGERVTLRLELRAERPIEARQRLAWFGSPRLVARP